MDKLGALKTLEIRIAQVVCGGGVVTRAETEEAQRLRKLTNLRYDAVNGRWRAFESLRDRCEAHRAR